MNFTLVKAKIKNDSLIITPNMVRFLALNLISSDSNVIAKIGTWSYHQITELDY